jgi:hypothetical protein
MRKPAPALCTTLAIATGLLVTVSATPWMAPVANAEILPNGYGVNCETKGEQAVCHVSGCPRVHDNEAGDVVHVRFNSQPQREIGKGCNNNIDVTTVEIQSVVNVHQEFTFSIQGCRKHAAGSDDCGAWSDYKYVAVPTQPPRPPKCPPDNPEVAVLQGPCP